MTHSVSHIVSHYHTLLPTEHMESWSRSPCDDPDSGPGLAIGLALGGCLLVAVLGAVACIWYRKRRMQTPTGSSTREPQQVEVTVAQPDSQKV